MAPPSKRHRQGALATPPINDPYDILAKNELDLFSGRPLQLCIESHKWCDLRPASTVSENNPVCFTIAGSEEEFLDPTFYLKMKLKIKASNGEPLKADSTTAPVNLAWSCNVRTCGFENSRQNHHDAQLSLSSVYVERLLNFGSDAKQTQLTSELFYTDTGGYFDSMDVAINRGL